MKNYSFLSEVTFNTYVNAIKNSAKQMYGKGMNRADVINNVRKRIHKGLDKSLERRPGQVHDVAGLLNKGKVDQARQAAQKYKANINNVDTRQTALGSLSMHI